ncbi:hypothetical protein NECAME_06147 [Necator americanus]|uniref:Uncharacterized protein n=1 Tax=Necator americanus TaxID=51031 RepID=W2TY83_NECAM|nr:hypothetical protein NECAME_06147 [Necator americanus]ETN85982.1 hypothetical protein NECAME_06147 [Necator americanus]
MMMELHYREQRKKSRESRRRDIDDEKEKRMKKMDISMGPLFANLGFQPQNWKWKYFPFANNNFLNLSYLIRGNTVTDV